MQFGLALFIAGITGFVLVQRRDRLRPDEDLSDEAAELRRIRRLIETIVIGGAGLALVLVMWHSVDSAEQSSEEKAEQLVDCILGGGTAEQCE